MARYIYATERNKMEREFKRLATACREAGMSEDKIEDVHRMLLDELNSNRRYSIHTVSYDSTSSSEEDEPDIFLSRLQRKFLNKFSTTQGEISEWERNAWIEDLDSDEIIAWARTLDEMDFQLITLLTVDGLKQTEIAKLWGITVSAISQRKKRLAKELAQICGKRLK